MDTRFQPSTSGPPRTEAALEEIRRLFERYRAHPDPRARSLRGKQLQPPRSRDAKLVPREDLINR
jgi:hypothetical protein